MPIALLSFLASLVAVALVTLYAWLVEPAWLRVRHRTVPVRGEMARLGGLRILHLSDLHVGRSNGRLARFMRRAGAVEADVVMVTGDWVERPEAIGELAGVLEGLGVRPDRPIVGILGNHDRYRYPHRWQGSHANVFDPKELVDALKGAGVRVLLDECVAVETRLGPVSFAGLDIFSHHRRGVERLLEGTDPRGVVLLAHSPDVFGAAVATGIPLLLAGHTHGGQVRIGPWFSPKTATRVPLKPASGLHHREGAWMHVSPGLGTTILPFRFFARPEATVIELRSRD